MSGKDIVGCLRSALELAGAASLGYHLGRLVVFAVERLI